MSEMPIKSVRKFYALLFSGKISESEKSLEYIRKKIGDHNPYYKALYGIYYSYVNDDRDSYIFKLWERYLDGVDRETLKNEMKKLLEESYNPPREFLQTWLDLVNIMDKLPTPHKIEKKESKPEESPEQIESFRELEEEESE